MKVLVTGSVGFIGRWLVKRLLDEGHHVVAIDDFSNGRAANIAEFFNNLLFKFEKTDIRNEQKLTDIFDQKFDTVYHLGAEINVQNSINNPVQTFERDVYGTFNILECCCKAGSKMIFMPTCMVYEKSFDEGGITEEHPTKPTSPYAAAKLSGEALTLSYIMRMDYRWLS